MSNKIRNKTIFTEELGDLVARFTRDVSGMRYERRGRKEVVTVFYEDSNMIDVDITDDNVGKALERIGAALELANTR